MNKHWPETICIYSCSFACDYEFVCGKKQAETTTKTLNETSKSCVANTSKQTNTLNDVYYVIKTRFINDFSCKHKRSGSIRTAAYVRLCTTLYPTHAVCFRSVFSFIKMTQRITIPNCSLRYVILQNKFYLSIAIHSNPRFICVHSCSLFLGLLITMFYIKIY